MNGIANQVQKIKLKVIDKLPISKYREIELKNTEKLG